MSPETKKFVSSANNFMITVFKDKCMSLMKIRNRNNKGPNTDPCGTPYAPVSLKFEVTPLVVVCCLLFDKHDSNHLRALPLFHSDEVLTTEYHD